MQLSRKLIDTGFSFPADVEVQPVKDLPERVIQFGEGNFLRAFVDWMFHRLNKEGLFNGKVVVVQPIPRGLVSVLNEQDGLYTLFLRGIQNGWLVQEKEVISVISRGINPYEQWEEYLKCAENPEIRYVISNTTEAGIAYVPGENMDNCPSSFPGKLTAYLYRRYQHFQGDPEKGMVIIPCELIDRNGDNLKRIVLKISEEWKLPEGFNTWVKKHNYFLNTLVDRIVTGYPRDAEQIWQELGYQDKLLNTGEIFHLWVIEGDKRFSEELPFHKVGLNVLWVDDMTPYRTRKVRILNGAHTMTVPVAFLYGKDTVKDSVEDPLLGKFIRKGIFEEIVPTLDFPEEEIKEFARAVVERFQNPFIKHFLIDIALNSISKFKTRVLPSLLSYVREKNSIPKCMGLSLAALMAFYRGRVEDGMLVGKRKGEEYRFRDDLDVLEFFVTRWQQYECSGDVRSLVVDVLGSERLWGQELNQVPGLADAVSENLKNIMEHGMGYALRQVIED
ncbi:tagaturonate reductase [Calderihabitans maritimus]|uniref:Tagaturonate reductase n=1 Tax=Calderihabitans maritimus TaxID=1246530 RepID=A0A1Z5HXS5_9FIRM|nr:tagaturonate reductase [Calderihabitans maritimus]GAW94115.1 Tagaturonate reductase [Calderihabitans maritimus]